MRGRLQVDVGDAVVTDRIERLARAKLDELVFPVVSHFPPGSIRRIDAEGADTGVSGRFSKAVNQLQCDPGTDPTVSHQPRCFGQQLRTDSGTRIVNPSRQSIGNPAVGRNNVGNDPVGTLQQLNACPAADCHTTFRIGFATGKVGRIDFQPVQKERNRLVRPMPNADTSGRQRWAEPFLRQNEAEAWLNHI